MKVVFYCSLPNPNAISLPLHSKYQSEPLLDFFLYLYTDIGLIFSGSCRRRCVLPHKQSHVLYHRPGISKKMKMNYTARHSIQLDNENGGLSQ